MEEQKTQNSPAAKNTFLECERDIVFILMMLVAGYFGAFTYSIRGGVFCNAQTGPSGNGSGKRPVVPRPVLFHSYHILLCGNHALRSPSRLCKKEPSDTLGYPADPY